VLHFAGSVAYSVEGFIEKNNDTLYTDLEALMAASDAPLVPDLFDASLHADAARDEEEAAEALAAAASSYSAGSGSGAAGAGDAGHMSPAGAAFGGAGKGGFGGGSGGAAGASAGGAKTSSTATIASRFKQSLGALNATLLATTPHYVRWCVMPCDGGSRVSAAAGHRGRSTKLLPRCCFTPPHPLTPHLLTPTPLLPPRAASSPTS
jgi:myosin heavy subunit